VSEGRSKLEVRLTRTAQRDVKGILNWSRREFGEAAVATLLTVSKWQEQIGDPTLADGILDRLVHNAYRIEMCGDSIRKNRAKT